MERGYQANFYTLCDGVRDPAIRQRKANKILWALTRYAGRPLANALCLDVGCSSGMMTVPLASLFHQTIGLDFDAIALAAVQPDERTLVDFMRGDAMCLPFPDASVDVVICAQVYEHVPNDALLFQEIYRVLAPGGIMFFSGPNWLFPIEPHYFLPFLHWLPANLADRYLQVTGLGDHYYEKLRPIWALRHLLQRFIIQDISIEIMHTEYVIQSPWLRRLVARLPAFLWRLFLPWLPNFNWILHKPLT